jgi:hypothetical protein
MATSKTTTAGYPCGNRGAWTVGKVKSGTQIWEQKPNVIIELITTGC